MKRLLVALIAAPIGILDAQGARESVDRGIAAFHVLDFEGSVRSLRSALSRPDAAQLSDSARAEVLGYVGAGELLLGRPAEAATAFRSALARAPDFRIDTLVFPPAVSTAFDAARGTTAYVIARSAGEVTLDDEKARFRVKLTASAPHSIRAGICASGGDLVRPLFGGAIADTLWIEWDGRLEGTTAATPGRLDLCVESAGSDGATNRLRLPLAIARGTAPSASATTGRQSRSWRGAAVGIGAGAIAVLLPELVATSNDWSGRRFVVGGTLLAASLFAREPPRVGEPTREGPLPVRVRALKSQARSEEGP